jgi:hypothetical protein
LRCYTEQALRTYFKYNLAWEDRLLPPLPDVGFDLLPNKSALPLGQRLPLEAERVAKRELHLPR